MKNKQFIGRPQTSCYQCHERRIKCGRERPTCLECRQASIECPGYAPKVSLDFKDESQLAARKVQARKRKQAEKQTDTQLGAHLKPCERAGNCQSLDLIAKVDLYYLPVPILDVALSCFVTQYLPGSLLSGIWPLYGHDRQGSPLSISVYALALASLAIDSGQPRVMTLARSQYARGLHRTNQALSNPKERITDDTLASILHLSLFEAIYFDEGAVQANWTAHVLGGLEILKLRGLGQLDTHLGRELYVAVILFITYSCIQRQIEMPQELIDLDAKASSILDNTHPKYRFRLLLNSFADIQFKRVTGISSPREIISQCLKLDEDIASIGSHELSAEVLGAALADGQDILVAKGAPRCGL